MNRLKQLRKDAKINQIDLCKWTGVNRSTLVAMERDKQLITTKRLAITCNLLSVSMDYIAGNSDYGIECFIEGERTKLLLNEAEYNGLQYRGSIKTTIINLGNKIMLDTGYRKIMVGGMKVIRTIKPNEAPLQAKKQAILDRVAQMEESEVDALLAKL